MFNKANVEKVLKKCLKSKVAYTSAVLVSFLINGVIAQGVTEEAIEKTRSNLRKEIKTEKANLRKDIAVNDKKKKEVEEEIAEYLERADFYGKPLGSSTQIFFNARVDKGREKEDRTRSEFKETIEPTEIAFENGETTGYTSDYSVGEVKDGDGVVVSGESVLSSIDIGANVNKYTPNLNVSVPNINLNLNVPNPSTNNLPSVPSVSSVSAPSVPNISVPNTSTPSITIPNISVPNTVAKVEVTPPSIGEVTPPSIGTVVVNEPTVPVFEVNLPQAPTLPQPPQVSEPTIITPPNIQFTTTAANQGSNERILKEYIMLENFAGYDVISDGAGSNNIFNIETGSTAAQSNSANDTHWGSSDLTLMYQSGGTASLNSVTDGLHGNYRKGNGLYAFFSSVADIDVVFPDANDVFNFTDAGANAIVGTTYPAKIFFSYNPAEVANTGSGWSGQDRSLTFNSTLNLASSGYGAGSNKVVIGFDYQLYAAQATDVRNPNVTATLNQNGTINLNSGTNIVGISISTENIQFIKKAQAVNRGIININSTNSIGFDFAEYRDIQPNVDISIGRINITGDNNYGIRLSNVFDETATYTSGTNDQGYRGGYGFYNRVNFYGDGNSQGVTNNLINITGTNNVGIAIEKSLSESIGYSPTGGTTQPAGSGQTLGSNYSPIENFTGVNILVNGDSNVGLLRMRDYSTNNDKDFVIDNNFLGNTGVVFGSNASNSVLYRADRYGIDIAADITLTETGQNGNILAQGIGAGNIETSGDITVTGDNFSGIVMRNTNGNYPNVAMIVGKNTGNLKLIGDNNVGITSFEEGSTTGAINSVFTYNSGNIAVEGNHSVAMYDNDSGMATGGSVEVEGDNSFGVYTYLSADTNDTKIYDNGTLVPEVSVRGDSIGVVANNGYINSNVQLNAPSDIVSSLPSNHNNINIDVIGNASTEEAIAVYATNGGYIDLGGSGNTITVENGSAGIASTGSGIYIPASYVNFTGGTMDFEGNGYALYSDGVGTIDFTNGNLILRGEAYASELDLSTGTSTVDYTNANITAMSNDVTVFNLLNPGNLATSTLESSITGAVGGVTIHDGVDPITGEVYDKYKVAVVENADISVDGNLDKADTTATSDGFFYYRRFLAQRSRLDVENGVTVDGTIDSAYASANFDGQVSGLEMNSTSNAVSNSETQINLLSGSTVIADRSDAGVGGVGLYINYGEANIDSGAILEVETGSNTVNDNGVGVFAVNGSKVVNDGSVEVAGNEAIGILGSAYRENSAGTSLGAEFGALAVGQGEIDITNNSDLNLTGEGSVGIYSDNNNTTASVSDANVSNTGTIVLGDSVSGGARSIGIYGVKSTLNNTGTITLGEEGIGIYGSEGSDVAGVGSVELSDGGIGVYIDETSTLSDASALAFTEVSGAGSNTAKSGVLFAGTGVESVTISNDIDTSGLVNSIALREDNLKKLTSSGVIETSSDGGIGIYGGSTIVNQGNINLTGYTGSGTQGATNIGIYGDGGSVDNQGAIDLNTDGDIGILIGSGGTLTQGGTLNFNTSKGIGVYGENVALNTNIPTINFVSGNSENIGMYLENGGTLNINPSSGTIASDNEDQNIFAYGKSDVTNAVMMTQGGTLTIDGVGSPTTSGNKFIGFYLENGGTANTFTGTGSTTVLNEAIGIYSKGENNVTLNNLSVDGGNTTGIFSDGDLGVEGNLKVDNTGTGIYSNSGDITVGSGTLNVTLGANDGTGIYLGNGSNLTGNTVNLSNTGGTSSIGVFVDGSSVTTPVNIDTDIVATTDDTVLVYSGNGAETLVNSSGSSITGDGNIGIYVTDDGSGKLSTTGAINVSGSDNMGLFVDKGTAINSGTITTAGSSSNVGMAAVPAVSGDIVKIVNNNQITGNGSSDIGIYSEGGLNTVENQGDIIVTSGTGVYISNTGGTNTYDSLGTGSITVGINGVGLSLENTQGGDVVDLGTLNVAQGGTGVYGNNSVVDFDIDLTTGTGITDNYGLVADGTTNISSDVTVGDGGVGVYVADSNVTFNNSIVTAGNTSAVTGGSSVGVATGDSVTMTLDNLDVVVGDGVGVALTNDSSTAPTTGSNVTYKSSVEITGGTGFYVPTATTLTTDGAVVDINGGTGIYVDGGSASIGTLSQDTFNLNGGSIFYLNDGSLNIGSNLTLTGAGSFGTVRNGSITSAANFTVGSGDVGIAGIYDSGVVPVQTIVNTGQIDVVDGGVGVAGLVDAVAPPSSGSVAQIDNQGVINVSGVDTTGNSSVGMVSEGIDVINSGTINVDDDGVGISYEGVVLGSVDSGTVNLTGDNGVGVSLNGNFTAFTNNNVVGAGGTGNIGVILSNNTSTSTVDLGSVALGDENYGAMVHNSTGSLTLDGIVSVGDSGTDTAVGLIVDNSNVVEGSSLNITGGAGSVGVLVKGGGTFTGSGGNQNLGVDGTNFYLQGGSTLNLNGNLTVGSDRIGVIVNDTSIVSGTGAVDVSGSGVGVVYDNFSTSPSTIPTINLGSGVGGTTPEYAVGVYFRDYTGTAPLVINTSSVNRTGNYNIGGVIDNSIGSVTAINIGSGGSDRIGVVANNNATLIGSTVSVTGDSNIGIGGINGSAVSTTGITVGNSTFTTDKSKASLGVFMKDSDYAGTGNVIVGDNSIGVISNGNYNTFTNTGDVSVGANGVGLVSLGDASNTTQGLVQTGDISVGNEGFGVFGKDTNIDVTTITGMNIAAGGSVGIYGEGSGDISYAGNLQIASTGALQDPSIGIYGSDKTGNVTVGSGNWNIGDEGYGIYLDQSGSGVATLTNNADLNLGEASVGIFSNGGNIVTNNGDITVGKTRDSITPGGTPLNSVGIYLENGSSGFNTGTITVNEERSIGTYLTGPSTTFENSGVINVDNGGVGVLARSGATATNTGVINLGGTISSNGYTTIGMAAETGATIINETSGSINVNEGLGMSVKTASFLENKGTININNGIGIQGTGTVINTGAINVTGTGTASNTTSSDTSIGSVEIKSDGTVIINNNLVNIGGSFTTSGSLILNGTYVDVTSQLPIFSATSVGGEVNITSDFALTGNGVTYKVNNFVNSLVAGGSTGTITPVTSPLFISRVDSSGNLIIVKRPYDDLTLGTQFKEMEDGLDELLINDPSGDDGLALKEFNAYLEDLSSEEEFNSELERGMSEVRGDIYATVQRRMQDINKSFEDSFDELVDSYNMSKDNDKFSVIYTNGDYNDDTTGIDDYDYSTTGLLYMKEYEGTDFLDKYGFTLGFAYTEFDFEDSSSEEDVYSLRVGAHNVEYFEDTGLSLLTGVELGYNYHDTEREFSLTESYTNDTEYSSYSVALRNELSKDYIKTLKTEGRVYAASKLEYGKFEDFDEDGTLELEIDSDDYFSNKLIVGADISQKFYPFEKSSIKVFGDTNFSYEFGNNYDGNKAKIKDASTGYYDLITPQEEDGVLSGVVGVTIGRSNHMDLTLSAGVSYDNSSSDTYETYSARLNYKF